jgi:hypothetical protein
MNRQNIILPIFRTDRMVVWYGGMGHFITPNYLILSFLNFCAIILVWNGLLYMNTNHTILVKSLIINTNTGMVKFEYNLLIKKEK